MSETIMRLRVRVALWLLGSDMARWVVVAAGRTTFGQKAPPLPKDSMESGNIFMRYVRGYKEEVER